MDILFVASELAPMVKVGGLADVVSALSKALRLLGHKVTIALPRFADIERAGVLVARRLTPLVLDGPGGKSEVTVLDGRLGSGVDLILLDVPGFHDRVGVYGERGEDYPDNGKRFALFARAVVELARQRAAAGQAFDVMHGHDWPGAMALYLLRDAGAPLAQTRGVLTIHNVGHQGNFPASVLRDLGLPEGHFHPDAVEFYGKASFLKAGILAADAITTVSATYAREIQTPEQGERLDGVLLARKARLTGIVNGVDYAVWNPMTDPNIISRYDAEDASNKGRCKSHLCQEIGIDVDPERPLFVSLGRTVHQKGSDLLAAALPRLLKMDVSIAIAGSGDSALMNQLSAAVAGAKGRAVYLGNVSEALSHRLLAGADAVLLPSRHEPCGLVQLYAQRYGAAPIATRTGGFIDTIVDCDAALETGTGFLFDGPTADGLVGAAQRAVGAARTLGWGVLRRRMMRIDVGWDRPARRYTQVYRSITAER
jgi:starch synthase